jgi:hypothetical protein
MRLRSASRKVTGSRPDEVNGFFFSIYLILPAAIDPGAYSASNRNYSTLSRKIMFLGSKVRPVRRAWQSCRHLWASFLCNVRSLTFYNSIGRHGQLLGWLYLLVLTQPVFNMLILKKKLNSMVWVRERNIPTERLPLVGEVIANVCG